MGLIRWLSKHIENVRIGFYVGTGVVFSIASLVLQSTVEPIYVSSVFDIGFEGLSTPLVKSTSGYLEPQENMKSCILKIVMPFDTPPPAIDSKYLCSWKDESGWKDSLCYTDFECGSIEVIHVLSILSPLLFMTGYLFLGGLLMYSKYRPTPLSRSRFAFLSLFGVLLTLSGFIIVKIVPHVTDYLLRDVFHKIRDVTIFKGGVNYLEFETIKYILHRKVMVARVLLDILAGFSAGFIFLVVGRYRQLSV
jgi:hypothetical protein